MADLFAEHHVCDGDKDFIDSFASVIVSSDGYFITVETDPYEGSAMFTLPVAIKVHESLGRAIELAKKYRGL